MREQRCCNTMTHRPSGRTTRSSAHCRTDILPFRKEKKNIPENGNHKVSCAEKNELLQAIILKYHPDWLKEDDTPPEDAPAGGPEQGAPTQKKNKRSPQKKRPVKPVVPHNREHEPEVTQDGPV